jgi:hypothetical protein
MYELVIELLISGSDELVSDLAIYLASSRSAPDHAIDQEIAH